MYRKGYNVYKNDQFVAFIPSRSFKAAKEYICRFLLSTHMGEWHRVLTIAPESGKPTCYERTYSTTIGVYYKFSPAIQEVQS